MKTLIAAAALAALAAAPVAAEEITAPGPQGPLAGTLVAPADGKPVVLIVPGSGPTDRDGNNPAGITAASYRLLAEALGARGIGSVRIDKRGLFGSKGAIADANAVTIADYVTDIAAWVPRIRQATGRDCVWLAGHSEGGLVALAAEGRVPGLCGVIVLAGPGMKMADILRAQFKANPANAPVLPDALRAIGMLEKGERVDVAGFHPALASVFNPAVQGYIIDLMTYDPLALAAATTGPLLVVQGGKDFQVPPANGAALHAARPSADYIVIPSMNHVLKDVEGDDPQGNLATYANPDLPISSKLVGAVAGFVTASRGAKEAS